MLPILGSLEGAEGLWRVRERRGVDTTELSSLPLRRIRPSRQEPQVFGFVGQAIRCRGAVNRGGDVGIQRVKDDQRRGDGDWKTR
jgi:hypothetical protein